jgi:hypothetical protein
MKDVSKMDAIQLYDLPNWLVHPVEMEDGHLYKYVRFADGRVLFCDMTTQHKEVASFGYTVPHWSVSKFHGQTPPPVSAGKIMVKLIGNKKCWNVVEGGSMSAKLPRLQSDEKYIQQELSITGKFEHNEEIHGLW